MNTHSSCCEDVQKKSAWQSPALWAVLVFAALLLISYRVEKLVAFREAVFFYFSQVGWMLVAGFLLGGVMDRFVPREYVSSVLAGKKKRSILHAVLFGLLLGTCSHGILALAVQLHKKGASTRWW